MSVVSCTEYTTLYVMQLVSGYIPTSDAIVMY